MQMRLLHGRLRRLKEDRPELAAEKLVQCLMAAQVPVWHAGVHTATELFGYLFETCFRVLNGLGFEEDVKLETCTHVPRSFAVLRSNAGPDFFSKLPAVISFLQELEEETSLDVAPLRWLLQDIRIAFENLALLA